MIAQERYLSATVFIQVFLQPLGESKYYTAKAAILEDQSQLAYLSLTYAFVKKSHELNFY
jgi:hypothetical protein